MKYIHYLNFFALGITLLLYLAIYTGMLAQLILGPLQLFLAVTITIKYYSSLNGQCKSLILKYWVLALASGLAALITWFANSNEVPFIILLVFVFPMSVACYFVYVTGCINQYLTPKP
jgi:hypothetical protein